MKTYIGVDVSSTVLDLGTRWRLMNSFTPRPLYPRGMIPRNPVDRMLGGPQYLCGYCEIETDLFPL
jgi:hypothetical protein